jgi:hypothetical protein
MLIHQEISAAVAAQRRATLHAEAERSRAVRLARQAARQVGQERQSPLAHQMRGLFRRSAAALSAGRSPRGIG